MTQLSIVQQLFALVPPLLVSLWSLFVALWSLRTNVRPTIVFSYGPHGWIFENVGNGPALNLMLYDGRGTHFERAV